MSDLSDSGSPSEGGILCKYFRKAWQYRYKYVPMTWQGDLDLVGSAIKSSGSKDSIASNTFVSSATGGSTRDVTGTDRGEQLDRRNTPSL